MGRPSCPRSLEIKLKREVQYQCPICGGIPLVAAHTIKVIKEVGWNYDYLLAICDECEKKVEQRAIDRNLLHKIKQSLKRTIERGGRTKPHQLHAINSNMIYIGDTRIGNCQYIIKYIERPLLWLEPVEDYYVLNAQFYDNNNVIQTAIDQNVWTAEREIFLDFLIQKIDNKKIIELIGKNTDMYFKFIIEPDKFIIKCGRFYVPNGRKIEIFEDGTIDICTNKFKIGNLMNSGTAIGIG